MISTSTSNVVSRNANGTFTAGQSNGIQRQGVKLAELPKSWTFTSLLPADSLFPSPAASHQTARDKILPRQVRDAMFTWVRPERSREAELLAVSPAAMRDLGLAQSEADDPDFRATAAGNKIWGFDDATLSGPGYPWAQCYGGFQFGQWAGQLGDGRAISLFEGTNPTTGHRYEVQLKGAGLTPYSRFADGKAVLRSSIREFVVSEALNALGIPSTRALALTLLPHERVVRERIEPGAIVVRMAETWLRLGSFDLLRARGDRPLLRTLADYVAENVLGGWERLPARLDNPDDPTAAESSNSDRSLRTGIGREQIEGPSESAENRYTRLYREIVRRNAATVAAWQAYGFMNGVLNTDNTSVAGLSIDFGPFAFLDDFDPSYTPNHDDHMLRYSYRNQPTIIWWNLVRLGEALGEMMGAGKDVDDPSYVEEGVKKEQEEELVSRAQKLISQAGEEYKAVFLAEYKRLMARRIGILQEREEDLDVLLSPLLELMENFHLDFNHFFRRLSTLQTGDLASEEQRRAKAAIFFHREGANSDVGEDEQRQTIADWLGKWRTRVLQDRGAELDAERSEGMKLVNPNFVPRGWILDEVIRRVEKQGERDVLRRIMHMSLHPFQDSWHGKEADGAKYEGDEAEEKRWTEDPPRDERAMQCSCSS
jgi:serine/tyrosine/threonine adenylyltransferase